MNTKAFSPSAYVQNQPAQDIEKYLLDRLVEEIQSEGIVVNPIDTINFYVSLKSKPLAILAGPRNSGKDDFIRRFSKFFVCKNHLPRNQSLMGHPWWAEKSKDISSLGQMHSQFNALKLNYLVEEAHQMRNDSHTYIANFCKVSPAEITELFSVISCQLRYGQVIDLPESFTVAPFSYPDNLLLIGSIDTVFFDWYSEDLLFNTSILQWADIHDRPREPQKYALESGGKSICKVYLGSRIRHKEPAYKKIRDLFPDPALLVTPVLEIESTLLKHGMKFSTRGVTDEALIYLSNSWSDAGNGLYASAFDRNLEVALDMIISQILIPRVLLGSNNQSTTMRILEENLVGNYPRSLALLDRYMSI